MNRRKVTEIKRMARKFNAGVNPSGGEMRVLKRLNKFNTVPKIKDGKLIMVSENIPLSLRIATSDKVKRKTIGKLSKQWKRNGGWRHR